MISSYETAKRVALGLEAEAAALPVGDDLWSITPAAGFGLAAEMPFQYFEKGFDPPDELTTQKAALMVGYIEEYTEDQRAAEKRLKTLKQLLAGGDAQGLRKLLNDAPPAQWLSMIFLEGGTLRDELVPLLKNANPACRAILGEALDAALEQMVNFKELLKALKACC